MPFFKNELFYRKVIAVLFYTIILLIAFAFIRSFFYTGALQVEEVSKYFVNDHGIRTDLTAFSDTTDGKTTYLKLEQIPPNQILVFRGRNLFVDIKVNDQIFHEDRRDSPRMFGNSPGSRWHQISLPASDEETVISIHGTACFSNSNGYIDNVYLGKPEDVSKKILMKNIFTFLTNALWHMFGAVLLLIYFFLHDYYHMGKDFLYLALGTFFCAQWCDSETTMWQYFLGHSELFHLIGYLSIIMIPIPFGLLAMERLEDKYKTLSHVYVAVSSINAAIITTLHMTGIIEFHYSVITVHILLLLLLPLAFKLIQSYINEEFARKHSKFLMIAFFIMAAFIVVGLSRYLFGQYSDFADYIRIALFTFLLLMMLYQFAIVNDVMKKGLQSELMHDLSLMDHLTKFYNRSGFAEHSDAYESIIRCHKPLGIIQFDVNNLKSVNDNQGHEKGDELICLASSGIYQSFGTYGKCYRMGGDEFLIILTGEDPKTDYETGIENLEIYCNYANSMEDRTYDLKIAHGFTLATPADSLSIAMARADALMYENKRWMKAQK